MQSSSQQEHSELSLQKEALLSRLAKLVIDIDAIASALPQLLAESKLATTKHLADVAAKQSQALRLAGLLDLHAGHLSAVGIELYETLIQLNQLVQRTRADGMSRGAVAILVKLTKELNEAARVLNGLQM